MILALPRAVPSHRHPVLVGGLAVAAAMPTGCGSSAGAAARTASTLTPTASTSAPAPTAATTTPSAGGNVTVDLTLTGSVTAHLTGTGPGTCDFYNIVAKTGLVYQISGARFGAPAVGSLQLSGESATATAAAIMSADNASWGWYPQDGGTVRLNGDRTGATIDATLTKIAGQDKVKVAGTIVCN